MIRFVEKEDIGQVLSMMEEVKEDFAGYKEEEFLDALEKAIRNREAFLEEEEGKLAGMISFSYEEKELTFLAVRPEFRKCGIGRKLVEQVKAVFTEVRSFRLSHSGREMRKALRHAAVTMLVVSRTRRN